MGDATSEQAGEKTAETLDKSESAPTGELRDLEESGALTKGGAVTNTSTSANTITITF